MVGCVTEGVDLEVGERVLGKFGEKPVDDEAAFDTALAVEDEDDFLVFGLE